MALTRKHSCVTHARVSTGQHCTATIFTHNFGVPAQFLQLSGKQAFPEAWLASTVSLTTAPWAVSMCLKQCKGQWTVCQGVNVKGSRFTAKLLGATIGNFLHSILVQDTMHIDKSFLLCHRKLINITKGTKHSSIPELKSLCLLLVNCLSSHE